MKNLVNKKRKVYEKYSLENIENLLKLNNIYNFDNELNINGLRKYVELGLINLKLLENKINKVLKLKGNKKKNVLNFFNELFLELNERKTIMEVGFEFGVEPIEPSLIPKKIYKQELFYLQVELLKVQEWLKKTGKTIIILFEGRDSAGKGSTIKKFVENLDPKYYNIIALGIPTIDERKNWRERYQNQIQKGKINLFDRSWYNKGLIEPVMGYGTPDEYEDFMSNVENYENDIVKNGDYLFKLWFSIDKETQLNRFEIRQNSPLKYWKYSPNDEKMQDLWDRFTEFKEKLFEKTSTKKHPWVIIDSNDKRISGLNAIRYVLQNIPYENKNKGEISKKYPEVLSVLNMC